MLVITQQQHRHRGQHHRSKHMQKLWVILWLTVVMGTTTFLASIQLQSTWLNLTQNNVHNEYAMPETALSQQKDIDNKRKLNKHVKVDISWEAQERWRPERNRKWRYYSPEARTTPIPSESCGPSPEFNKFFEEKGNRRSANDEDMMLYGLFGNALRDAGTSGSYVDVGAYNGRVESNTRFFHECLGWHGLLIEANPKIYNALVRNRPYDHRLSYSPTCTLVEEMSNTTVPFHAIDSTKTGIKGNAILHMGTATTDVPCGSLTSVLGELFPKGHIDLLSLDVEGSEADVVEKMDFDQLFIELIMVENTSRICGRECLVRDRVRRRLQAVGYARYSNVLLNSDLFIHPDSKYELPDDYPTIPVEEYILAAPA